MITIANVRDMHPNDPHVIYCGRSCYGWTGSVLGNPFRGERMQAIAQYKVWLEAEYAKGEEVYVEITRIANLAREQDVVLGCWCAPLACHTEVIRDFIEYISKLHSIRLIIAGSRTITNQSVVFHAIEFVINWLREKGYQRNDIEIVVGGARGVDTLGALYASENHIDSTLFPADWDKEGKSAGFKRNRRMAEYANCLCLVWDGKSKGSAHMKQIAMDHKLKIFEKVI